MRILGGRLLRSGSYALPPREASPARTNKTGNTASNPFCHVLRWTHHPCDLDEDGCGNVSGGYHFPIGSEPPVLVLGFSTHPN